VSGPTGGSGVGWKRAAAAVGFIVAGPVAGLVTLAMFLALSGGSWEGGGGSPAGYAALVIPVSCGIAAFGIARRLALRRAASVVVGVLAGLWTAGSWVLLIVAADL
jgi:hypothetical protein